MPTISLVRELADVLVVGEERGVAECPGQDLVEAVAVRERQHQLATGRRARAALARSRRRRRARARWSRRRARCRTTPLATATAEASATTWTTPSRPTSCATPCRTATSEKSQRTKKTLVRQRRGRERAGASRRAPASPRGTRLADVPQLVVVHAVAQGRVACSHRPPGTRPGPPRASCGVMDPNCRKVGDASSTRSLTAACSTAGDSGQLREGADEGQEVGRARIDGRRDGSRGEDDEHLVGEHRCRRRDHVLEEPPRDRGQLALVHDDPVVRRRGRRGCRARSARAPGSATRRGRGRGCGRPESAAASRRSPTSHQGGSCQGNDIEGSAGGRASGARLGQTPPHAVRQDRRVRDCSARAKAAAAVASSPSEKWHSPSRLHAHSPNTRSSYDAPVAMMASSSRFTSQSSGSSASRGRPVANASRAAASSSVGVRSNRSAGLDDEPLELVVDDAVGEEVVDQVDVELTVVGMDRAPRPRAW